MIWDALPKNDAGKVLKHQIRATLTRPRWVGDMQVAIVTGASSGIGFGMRRQSSPRWAWRSSAPAATRTGWPNWQQAVGDPDRVATIAVDLTADDAPRTHRRPAVERWGHIDFLVNNAGVGSPKPLHETDDESLDYFLGLDAAGAVPAGARRDTAHARRARRSSTSRRPSPSSAACAAAPTPRPRAA